MDYKEANDHRRSMDRKISDFLRQEDIKEHLKNNSYAFEESRDCVIENLKTDGYVSLSNSAMSIDIKLMMKVHSAQCFTLTEGVEDYFILNLDGAKSLFNIFEKDVVNKYHHWKPYRIRMREIVKAQLKALIDNWGDDNDREEID